MTIITNGKQGSQLNKLSLPGCVEHSTAVFCLCHSLFPLVSMGLGAVQLFSLPSKQDLSAAV